MLTPQEVSSHAFPKAVMGGYNMAAVDEFLDELTDDYASLYKENAALKAKLKVLVEKVEDYRSTEDSMRATLLTAQKMADSIVREAEVKRDQLLSQAEADARTRIGEMENEVTETARRMNAGKRELAEFIAGVRGLCAREVDFLDQLPQLPAEERVPAAPADTAPAVSEIEQNIFSKYGGETAPEQPADDAPAQPEPEAADPEAAQPEPEQPEYPEGNPFEGGDDPTRRINLRELKFGRNYAGAADEDEN